MDNNKKESNSLEKVFRITYRNEVYVTATNEEDAINKFQNMPKEELDFKEEFVERISVEEQ